MQLSAHFTLDELTISQAAARHGLDNKPPAHIIDTLTRTASWLEAVRTILGAPITISSGYRSPDVNRLVGGAKSSQHTIGEAVDFICPGFGTPYQIVDRIIKSGVQYDQLIVEYGSWVHISFSHKMRKQALIIDKSGTRVFS